MKGFITFFLFVAGPIVFWILDPGVKLMEAGYVWGPFATAPVAAFLFAIVNSEGKVGKGLYYKDDQGNKVFNLFWGLFILLTVVLLGAAFMIKSEL